MVTEARAESSSTQGTADVGVKARNDVVGSQAPDLQALHLRYGGDQDVSSFGLRQIHRRHPNVIAFQPLYVANSKLGDDGKFEQSIAVRSPVIIM